MKSLNWKHILFHPTYVTVNAIIRKRWHYNSLCIPRLLPLYLMLIIWCRLKLLPDRYFFWIYSKWLYLTATEPMVIIILNFCSFCKKICITKIHCNLLLNCNYLFIQNRLCRNRKFEFEYQNYLTIKFLWFTLLYWKIANTHVHRYKWMCKQKSYDFNCHVMSSYNWF